MMEQDFDEIGKRLYDLEANPPDDGWKRIAGAVNNSHPTSWVLWIRKNWWTPLVLIVPTFLYLGYSELGETNAPTLQAGIAKFDGQAKAISHEWNAGVSANDQQESTEKITHRVSTSNNEQIKTSAINEANSLIDTNINSTLEGQVQAGIKTETQSTNYKLEYGAANSVTMSGTGTEQTMNNEKTSLINTNADPTIGRLDDQATVLLTDIQLQEEGAYQRTNETATTSETHLTQERISNSIDQNNIPETSILLPNTNTAVSANASANQMNGAAIMPDQPAASDDNKKLNATTETDTVFIKSDLDKSDEQSGPTWKVNVSVMPQYVSGTIQPLVKDEVFVTKVEDNHSPTSAGIEIGLGISRSLSSRWHLDARLAYNKLSQEITHSYSDGTVDTLIRVKQPDESVRVTPVYHVTNREININYHYASLSLGTTYYFLATAKSRFNFSASMDMHYLLSAQIKEKINDQWVSLDNNSTNKANYSFTIGAGYSVTLHKGLEVMVSPSLRYFMKDIQSEELPYKSNQQSVGINFMLVKTIGMN